MGLRLRSAQDADARWFLVKGAGGLRHHAKRPPFGGLLAVNRENLVERFILFGGGISAIVQPEDSLILSAGTVASVDPAMPVYGPFSEDFRWVTVSEIRLEPIHLTPKQAAVFKALWHLRGQPVPGQRVMQAAGSSSTKPGDLFKHRNYALTRRVFDALVTVDIREGLYALPCARNAITA